MSEPARSRLLPQLWWLLPLAGAWAWYATVITSFIARIRALDCVENYGFAVFDQIIYNAATTGHFQQTIHFGYVDDWLWSGHRCLYQFVIPWLYSHDPGPEFLARLQVGVVALGALPAFGLGRRAIAQGDRGLAGALAGVLGMLVYLCFPALMALARADYQDLLLGVPFMLAAIHQSRRESSVGFLLAGFAACAAREEWAMMLPLVGLSFPGRLKQRAGWCLRGLGVSLVYAAFVAYLGRNHQGYDNQTASHLGGVFLEGVRFTRSWTDVERFYLGFLQPVQGLAVLAPLTTIPAAGALFFHLTAPSQGGIDTQWSGHIHHMAPVATFLIAGCIDAMGVLEAGIRRLPRFRGAVRVVLLGLAGGWVVRKMTLWLAFLHITPTLTTPTELNPPRAPEWALAAQVPAGATVATDTHASLTLSSRTGSYTYSESLADKTRGRGLDVVEYAMIRNTDSSWVGGAVNAGATVVGSTATYTLYKMPWALH